jgi:hypothetical protein
MLPLGLLDECVLAATDSERVQAVSARSVQVVVVRDEIAARPLAARQAVKKKLVPTGTHTGHTESQRARPIPAARQGLRSVCMRAPEAAEEVEGRPIRPAAHVDGSSGHLAVCNEVDPHAKAKTRMTATVSPNGHQLTRPNVRFSHHHAVVGKRSGYHDECHQDHDNGAPNRHVAVYGGR